MIKNDIFHKIWRLCEDNGYFIRSTSGHNEIEIQTNDQTVIIRIEEL